MYGPQPEAIRIYRTAAKKFGDDVDKETKRIQAREGEEIFPVDMMQKIHTIYNLASLLC